jgi:hypothetical protein
MSTTLVDRSPDLARLVEDGFDIEIRDTNLLVHHVPYVTVDGGVSYCVLVSELTTNGERTDTPGQHDVRVVGGVPYDHQGSPIFVVIDQERFDYGNGLVASCRMSAKPHGRMPTDYHEKITTYVRILGQPARAIDPTASHLNYPVRESTASESVFRYHDSATSRAGLSAVTGKLKVGPVAIVGLGGTGSYILDLVAKTPVEAIHLFDDDELMAHNAFRAPGAASLEDLQPKPRKVDYLFAAYDSLHRNIVVHPVKITGTNVIELQGMSFVFLAMDAGPVKRLIVDQLAQWSIAFVDCGIGMHRQDNSLGGLVRTTIGLPNQYDHVARRISFGDVSTDEYRANIQTADLNMLNAALAVLKWKKHLGYYADSKRELNSTYTVATNLLVSGETPE